MMDNQLPKLQEIGVTPIWFFKKKKKKGNRGPSDQKILYWQTFAHLN